MNGYSAYEHDMLNCRDIANAKRGVSACNRRHGTEYCRTAFREGEAGMYDVFCGAEE